MAAGVAVEVVVRGSAHTVAGLVGNASWPPAGSAAAVNPQLGRIRRVYPQLSACGR